MKDFAHYHHRRSIRLQGYDYSKEGMYFITICTHKKQHAFGYIENGIMNLNEAGMVAQKCWLDIPVHYPNVILHDFIIMPDHIHGIIELVGVQYFEPVGVQNGSCVGVQNIEPRRNEYQHIIPRSIGSIIRGYKIGVTKWFREKNGTGVRMWQRNFYEHIIRNDQSYERISHYIINNPKKWVN